MSTRRITPAEALEALHVLRCRQGAATEALYVVERRLAAAREELAEAQALARYFAA